jgi:poly(ADP-ribose) polymerase-like protein
MKLTPDGPVSKPLLSRWRPVRVLKGKRLRSEPAVALTLDRPSPDHDEAAGSRWPLALAPAANIRYPEAMPHVFEPAPTGRAKCRGCGRQIEKGDLRFGERIPNPYAEGETTLWFHPLCAAYKRPESMLEALGQAGADPPSKEALERAARGNSAQRRLPRIDSAERAPTAQAKCRNCHEPIPRGTWRIRLVFYEEGRFSPSGFLHLGCRLAYFETGDIVDPLLHFSPDLSEEDRADLLRALKEDPGPLPAANQKG